MKYGYICNCGWHLDRGNLTRREYAVKKELHAYDCRDAANELRTSRSLPRLTENDFKPYDLHSN